MISTVAGAFTLSMFVAGCVPGANATIYSDCDDSVDIFIEERPSYLVERPFELDVYRESVHVKTLEPGATVDFAISPGEPRPVMVIVYGADTAKIDYFGDQLTGSLDYTITGDMCLTPAATD